jgi:hypothetical protein
MGDTANPTTPGPHNHLARLPAPRDPANPRAEIDRVFGIDASVIEGLPIEVGHGCKSVAWQLAEHVRRAWAENGRAQARALILKLCANKSVDQGSLAEELVARGLMSAKTAASSRALEEFSPSGTPN